MRADRAGRGNGGPRIDPSGGGSPRRARRAARGVMAGSSSISLSKASRRRTSVSTRSTATAVADRARPSRSASSPKKPPAPMVVRIAGSLPSSGSTMILTDPLATMYSESPGSPPWKITSPRLNRRARMAPRTRSIFDASSPANSRQAMSASRTSGSCDEPGTTSAIVPGPRPLADGWMGCRAATARLRWMGATTCSSCGASIPERYRLCGSCGTPREAARGPVEIRRFATVVNSDLKGSTALGERLDPETLREVLTLYFDEMRLVFESHGGTIEKIIGDAIVAVFGLPVRHDDDALRAVEAAAETQRALAALNDRLDQTWGVRLVVRTGIATGEVTFGEASIGQHILTGDTMVISSAMEQNAPPLEVLIAGSTYDLVRDMVDAEPVEPVTPKGGHEAHPAYRLVSVAARPQAGHAGADTAAAGLRLCPACGEENPASFRRVRDVRHRAGVDGGGPRQPQDRHDRVRGPEAGRARRRGTEPRGSAGRDDPLLRGDAGPARGARRDRGAFHRRCGHGGLRSAGPTRGRRSPGRACGGGDAGRPARPQRPAPADLGDGDRQPCRGQHGRSDRRGRAPRSATRDR